MLQGDIIKTSTERLPLRPALLEAITILQSHGGRLTAPELQVQMKIGLSTAYTYLKELLTQDVVERLKIQNTNGASKQFLYVLRPMVNGLNGFGSQDSTFLETTHLRQERLSDQSDDPVEEVLEILSYLAEKVKTLEQKYTNLEQEKFKHYPLISALKKEMGDSNGRGV